MDGFSGSKDVAAKLLLQATLVIDPFHVVSLAGDKIDQSRQRIQQLNCRHRGRSGKAMVVDIINTLHNGVSRVPEELASLGRTFRRRHDDVLANFDHHAPKSTTEAINSRLEACAAKPSDSGT